ncbi:MAG: outer membrane beta-barrel protein [Marinilabiliaceae bacterium]|nr:outer membrane beta-barrel protein [Marinilabiliaceae bacterium]
MKNLIFLTLFLIIPVFTHAQPDSSKIIIRFSGGYSDNALSNGVTSIGAVNANITDWNLGLKIGTLVGKNIEIGLGIDYLKQQSEAQSQILIRDYRWIYEYTTTDAHLVVGKAYLSYRWQILNRFYFNPIFSIDIGKTKGEQVIFTALSDETFSSEPTTNLPISDIIWLGKESFSHNYFAINLSPAFSYYFSPHFAINLEIGRFGYSTIDWGLENKQWLASLNPAYWQVGLIFAF